MQFQYAELKDCREFALTLRASPPRLVHGTLLILTLLLVSALSWSWWTQADLVVQAAGRVRPITPPKRVVCTVRDARSGGSGLRVVGVEYRLGEMVRKGDVLVRLDTEQIDNEIARRKRTIQSGEEELASLSLQERLHEKQLQATTLKLESQRDQALAEEKLEKDRKMADASLAQVEVDAAAIEVERRRPLLRSGAVSDEDFKKTKVEHAVALAKKDKAALPVDESKVKVARQAIAVLELESAVKREELVSRIQSKRSEIETAQLELKNLEIEKRQSCLLAPIDGIVSAGEIRVGDVLDPNKMILEVSEQNGFYFEANVPSSEMAHVKPGMPARVRLDAYDYQRYGTLTGTVRYVSPDSIVTNERASVSYLVRIELDQDTLVRGEWSAPVKLGLSGQVEVISDTQSLLRIFIKKIRQKISLG